MLTKKKFKDFFSRMLLRYKTTKAWLNEPGFL
jgi:hypothetical protein